MYLDINIDQTVRLKAYEINVLVMTREKSALKESNIYCILSFTPLLYIGSLMEAEDLDLSSLVLSLQSP